MYGDDNPLNLSGEELEKWNQFISKRDIYEQEKYRNWLMLVNYDFEQTAGIGIDAIEDMPYRDWFDDGVGYQEAVDMMLERLG